MHELAIAESILNISLKKMEEQKLKKILAINVVIGELQNYEESWLQSYMDQLSVGTPAEGVRVHVETVPVTFQCKDCDAVFKLNVRSDEDLCCKNCGGMNYKMITGKEFYIKNMEASD